MNDIRAALDEYLNIRRAMGFKLQNEGTTLFRFVHFLEKKNASFITTDLALEWAILPQDANPAHWARRLGMVRVFAQFHSASDPRTEIPPKSLLPFRYRRKAPYIYSDYDISKLLEASGRLRSTTGLRAFTYSTLFGLLAVTGMRVSESIALDRQDVDFERGLLSVRLTKFGKSRLIPVHSSTVEKLSEYRRLRDRTLTRCMQPSFFVSDQGKRLTRWGVRWTFVKLSREIGLRGPLDSHGPRLHDLRHTFAVKTLLNWYRADADVERRMPELGTFLGHAHVNDTYWYISATPELLRLAGERLETK